MKPLTRLCRRHKTSLWGQPHFVTPRLVDWIHGDGLKVIYLTPLATRPDYYLVRIDSKVEMSNHAKGAVFADVVLPSLYEEIESEFLNRIDEYEHDNGRTYTKHHCWPALDDSCGCAWGVIETLSIPDRRPERRVRADIKRAA